MRRAVIFDLYETLITENHPEWHVEVPTPGERLGLPQGYFAREWSGRYRARMTGKLRDYSSVLREICSACGVPTPEGYCSSVLSIGPTRRGRPALQPRDGRQEF